MALVLVREMLSPISRIVERHYYDAAMMLERRYAAMPPRRAEIPRQLMRAYNGYLLDAMSQLNTSCA